MIKLQSDFLGPFFVEDRVIVRPMGRNTLKLTGELSSARAGQSGGYIVTDSNDEQETWRATMKEIIYLEANRFLKQPDFERFVCLASGEVICEFGPDTYPRVKELFPDGFKDSMQHVQAHYKMASVIERSYYRRLAQNHFIKANAIRDGDKQMYGLSTDVMTRNKS